MDKTFWWVLAALFVVVFVLVGVPLINKARINTQLDENMYNGFTFSERPEGKISVWETVVQAKGKNYQLSFYHHPREVSGVVVQQGIIQKFLNTNTRPSEIIITLPANAGSVPVIAAVEISKITGHQFDFLNIDTKSALQSQPSGNAEVAVVTCADATNMSTVIKFEEGVANIIFVDEVNPDCIHLQYRSANESIEVADRFAYGILQIMSG